MSPFIAVLLSARDVNNGKPILLIFFLPICFALWLLWLIMTVDAFAFVYGLKRPFFMPSRGKWALGLAHPELTGAQAVRTCLISYALTLYGFAVSYVLTSHLQKCAFHPGPLGAIDGLYFSTVTAATVGYGDIYPRSALARFLVMGEIFVSLAYGIFLFSMIAGIARGARQNS